MREVRGAEKYRAVHSPARSAEGVIQSKMSAVPDLRNPGQRESEQSTKDVYYTLVSMCAILCRLQ